MPAEILLYQDIYSYSAAEYIREMNEAADDAIVLRINGNGGSPEYGWGMVAKFIEHAGEKTVKVDGMANSMYLFFCCYTQSVECLDVSSFLLHRAAYPEWLEQNQNYMTDVMWQNLDAINANLRKALEAKIDVAKFEALKGVKIKDVFSNATRIEVSLTAQEAKKIGLINKIIKITPEKQAQIQNRVAAIAAKTGMPVQQKAAAHTTQNTPKPVMDIHKFKADHPEIYAQVFDAGKAAETDRVGAWMAFVDIDPEAVAKGIKEGQTLTATAMAELSRKGWGKEALGKIEAESAKQLPTTETPAPGAEKPEVTAFKEALKPHLKPAI